MRIISHRGNLNGPSPKQENQPDYIRKTLSLGFEAEIDVWRVKNQWWLGHDRPTFRTDEKFIKQPKLWCHAKNSQALLRLLELKINCFWHETDERTLTSKGFIWTYPGKELTKKSIACLPEQVPGWIIAKAAGVCTDYPYRYEKI
ncbi:MAG: hypothetical protein V1810_01965 [Candidatus Beckwithbacteria bacterium]